MAGFEFVSLDDPTAVAANPNINVGFTAEGIRWAFTDIELFYWQPLTYLSHMFATQLFGLNASGHHILNLLIHAANVVLLFLLLLRLGGSLWRSTAVATLFAIHPLAVESVAWVTERNNLLATLFSILTLLAYVKWVERQSTARYVPVVIASVLAVMSKPMAVSIPLALLLLDWWPLRRLNRANFASLCGEKWLLFAIAAGSVAVTIAGNAAHLVAADVLPFYIRLSSSIVAYAQYLVMFVWPDPLGVFYQYAIPEVEQTSASILALVLLTLGAFSVAKRYPYLLFGWIWYLVMLVPVSGMFQTGGQAIADRFTYWPSIGIYVAVVWGVADCVERWNIKRGAVVAASAVIVLLLGGKAWLQNETWQDSISLYSQALDATGGNEPMHRNLAAELAARGKVDQAIYHYGKALQFDPNRAGLHYAVGHLQAANGLIKEASQNFNEELRINKDFVPALKELGFLYMRQSRLNEAASLFRHVLRIDPKDADINPMRAVFANIPEKPDAPKDAPAQIAAGNETDAPNAYVQPPLVTPGFLWNCAAVLACVALGFLIPRFGGRAFDAADAAWMKLSRRKTVAMAVVTCAPLIIRLLLLPVQPVPKPTIHDEFGYLLIADTFANGRVTNPTPSLWQHFTTHYVFFEPSYTSKYPVGEPAFMAFAQVFGLSPWFGVWLGTGLMCGALYWMLGGWLPPKWALLGALIAAFRFGISSYWMNSYWGGSVAALGGALVLGALPRIRRHVRMRDSFLLGAGLVLLANTRPYEGFLLSIPVAVMLFAWLFRAQTIPISVRLRQVVVPVSLVLVAGFAFTLYYNWRVTGNAFLMPYKQNQKLYGTPTPFYFEAPLAEPAALSADKDLRDNFLWQQGMYQAGSSFRDSG